MEIIDRLTPLFKAGKFDEIFEILEIHLKGHTDYLDLLSTWKERQRIVERNLIKRLKRFSKVSLLRLKRDVFFFLECLEKGIPVEDTTLTDLETE